MRPKQLFYGMLGTIALLIVGAGSVFYFANKSLSKTTEALALKEEDIQVATKEVANLQTLRQQLIRVESIKPEIDAALPKEKTQSQAVAQILEIARANGVVFRSIQFEATQGLPAQNSQTKPSTVVTSVSTVPITLETESISYETLKNFLRDVLGIRRNANVNSLIVNRDSENPGHISARIVIDIHLEKVEAPLTDAEKAKQRKELEEESKKQ